MPLIPYGQPKRRSGIVALKPLRASGIIEAGIKRKLDAEIRLMLAEVQPIANSDLPAKEKYQKLWAAVNVWEKRFEALGERLGTDLFQRTFSKNKEQLIKQLTDTLKVDVDIRWDDKRYVDMLTNSVAHSTALIRSIPQQYIGEVTKAVMLEAQKQIQPEGRSLWQQIQHVGGTTKSRAILIARDQTSKANAAITEFQSSEAGSPYYIWKTSQDERVVGTPGGLYPKGTRLHGDHYHRNGKKYFWTKPTAAMRRRYPGVNDPPVDGNAGQPICCRCWSSPQFDRANV